MIPPVPPPPRRWVMVPVRTPASDRVLRPWWFLAAAGGVMLFIAYGSYVPFDHRPREWAAAATDFRTAMIPHADSPVRAGMRQWNQPPSPSDFAANVALGVPLGFCLLGAARVDRWRRWPGAVLVLPAGAFAALFAAGVEFGQLFFRERVCSGWDVLAQGIGAAAGAVGWVAFGQWATNGVRAAFDADGVRASTAPLLVGYAGLLLLVQLLPLDLTASPRDVYHRLRDTTTWVPLGELFHAESTPDRDLKAAAGWCQLFALYLPAGLLLAGLPGRFGSVNGLFRVVGVGLLAAVVIECCQVLVESRRPSVTDVLIGALGVVVGWAVARILSDRGVRKRRAEAAVLLAQAWAAVLAVIAWHPYHFYPGIAGERLGAMNWLPLGEAIRGQYLWAAEDLLAKFALAMPLGAVVAWGFGRRAGRWPAAAAVLACGAVAAVLEAGQAMLPSRTVCPTDVLVATAGGWLGAVAVRRTHNRASGGRQPPGVVRTPAEIMR